MRIDDSWDPRRPYYDVLSIGKRKALYQGASNDLLMAGKRSRRHVGQEHQTFCLYRYKKSNTSPKSPTKQCKSPTKQHTERLFCAPSKQHKGRLLRGGLSNEGCSMWLFPTKRRVFVHHGTSTYLFMELTSTTTSYGWLGTGGSGGGEGTFVPPPTRYIVTTRMTLLYGGQLCQLVS